MVPLPNNLSEIVDQLLEAPQRTAIIERHAEGSARWNRGEFSDRIQRLAAGLQQRGVSTGDRVALMSPTSAESVVVALATIVAGGIIVPLDAQFEPEVLKDVLRDCRPSFLFTTSETLPRLEESYNPSEVDIYVIGGDSGQNQSWQALISEGRISSVELDTDDYAVLFYTSGTTGPPKGVPLTHRNLALQIRTLANAEIISPDDRVLLPLPIHHVYPFVVGVLTTLALHLPIVIPQSLTGPEISAALREEKINIVVGVPRLYEALYESIENRIEGLGRVVVPFFQTLLNATDWLERNTPLVVGKTLFRPLRNRVAPELRLLTSGGSPLDPELYRKLNSLGWEIGVGYGLTETSPLLTLNLPRDGNSESVGKPIEETEIRIDTESIQTEDGAQEGTADTAGEILARGAGVFKEYWNRTEKTEEAFTEDGWFRTGDLGYFDKTDFLYVTGRVSTMIVTSSGENIHPDDVEEAITTADEIAEAGVLKDDDQLVAVIVPEELDFDSRNGEAVDIEQRVSDAVRRESQKLPSYQRIENHELSSQALPRTRLGKIRRHKLKARYRELLEGKQDDSSREPISIDEMAASDRELLDDERVNSVWNDLCERYSDKNLSPDSSLQLDLGVDSMEWINLSIEVQERTGIPLTDEKIRDLVTIRDLLQTVTESVEKDQQPEELLADPEAILSDDQRRWVEPLGSVRRIVPRYGYVLNRALQKTFFQLDVTGRENLPHEGPFVIAANHISSLDPFMIAAALDQQTLQRIYWAAWTGRVFQNAIARQFSRCIRSIPIDPAQGPVASLAVASAVLKRGNNLVWFPEGQRSPNGKLQSLRPGLGRLLEHDNVPVVPTSIQGTYAALPPDRYTPRFKPVTVTFGKPHHPKELEELGQGDHTHERIIDGLKQKLRSVLEETSNEASD